MMSTTVFFVGLLLVCSYATAEEKKCTPGHRWREKCNRCVCTNDGIASCTEKVCIPTLVNLSDQALEGFRETGEEEKGGSRKKREQGGCTAGTSWTVDCNVCVCTNDGFTACSNQTCPTRAARRARTPTTADDDGRPCKPGDTWMEDCNQCFCSPQGYPGCGKMLCDGPSVALSPDKLKELGLAGTQRSKRTVGQLYRTSRGIQSISQKPGTSWNDGCNSCVITESGRQICTQRACPVKPKRSIEKEKPEEERCTPGTHWKSNCNNCFCTAGGFPACTKRRCIHNLVASRERRSTMDEDKHGLKKCTPGDNWKEDCNSCFCTDDGFAACTKKGCVHRPVLVRDRRSTSDDEKYGLKKCTPGDNWKEDCNSCFCTDNGFAACTKKGCKPRPVLVRDRRSTSEECKEKDGWKEGCNTCFCVGGQKACTKAICEEEEPDHRVHTDRKKRKACEPGHRWMNDCNSCSCTSTGIPICTRKLCRGPLVQVPKN